MIAKTPRELGLLMRERRRKLGLDQGELASRAHVSRQWVIEMEQGKPRAEVGLVLRALGVLGLALDIQEERARVAHTSTRAAVDLDAVIERARGARPEEPARSIPRPAPKHQSRRTKKARSK